jgi:hypothetical protein
MPDPTPGSLSHEGKARSAKARCAICQTLSESREPGTVPAGWEMRRAGPWRYYVCGKCSGWEQRDIERYGPIKARLRGVVPAPEQPADQDRLAEVIGAATFDPGKFVERNMAFSEPRWEGDAPGPEPLYLWQARAVKAAVLGVVGQPDPEKEALRAEVEKTACIEMGEGPWTLDSLTWARDVLAHRVERARAALAAGEGTTEGADT